MTNSVQLEREAEQTRSRLAETLDELRERMTPGQLVDQAVDYAKASGGGVFVRNLKQQMTGNPLPVALIGAAMVWLMLSTPQRSASTDSTSGAATQNKFGATRDTTTRASARISEAGQEQGADISDWASAAGAGLSQAVRQVGEQAQGIAGQTRESAEYWGTDAMEQARQKASSLAEGISSGYESAKSQASDAYGRVSDKASRATSAAASSVSDFGQRAGDAGKDLLQFCKTQPLLLAGLGLALGAIIGSLIPPTETEDRLMGDTSDHVRGQARAVAKDQYEKAKSAAESGVEQAQAHFQSQERDGRTDVPAETSLVPEAEHDVQAESVEQDK
jgi:ElaB/YqjD/DUF883 family membrane-anchored ribosome-binding protein